MNNPVNGSDPSGLDVIKFSVSGNSFGIGGSAGLFISYPGPGGNDNNDIGGFVTGQPPSLPASLALQALDPSNPVLDMSAGIGAAKLTADFGWDASRSSMDGIGLTSYGGYGVGLKTGGSLSWDIPSGGGDPTLSELAPSGVSINYGYQGVPYLPFNAGFQVDYTKSFSIGDLLINYVFPLIDNVTNGWFSGTNNKSSSAAGSNTVDDPAINNETDGGFVLYPNMSNTNQLQSVYRK
ncbi:hypothetical protein [Methylomonas sp. AM2-LC]|uniref:hypothetical protein n=1 Tax=Methylomonas sp. AM2-LC TaxID=3153301 RepID=UPI0032666763